MAGGLVFKVTAARTAAQRRSMGLGVGPLTTEYNTASSWFMYYSPIFPALSIPVYLVVLYSLNQTLQPDLSAFGLRTEAFQRTKLTADS